MTKHPDDISPTTLAVRAPLGGVLMGLANLVPGISGGTMLLATGVYTQFVGAVAAVTTLKFRLRPLLVLGIIAGSALVAILLLAGLFKTLVSEHRWVMYSIFIGLTLGGIPVVWRMLRRWSKEAGVGFAVGFGGMAVLAAMRHFGVGGDAAAGFPILLVAGIAGASAMILPGVSGAYLLIVLGQYETILGAVDQLKNREFAEAKDVVIPVAIGVVVGVVGVSNLIRWMLARHERLTLGLLLGLLAGSVLGLFPFRRPVEPDSKVMQYFAPAALQACAAIGLVGAGFIITSLIDRVGGGKTA